MLPRFSVFIQKRKIGLHGSAVCLLHVTSHTLLDTPPYLSVTIPGKAKLTKKLTKLLIIHKIKALS
jgi:hypothetical protein